MVFEAGNLYRHMRMRDVDFYVVSAVIPEPEHAPTLYALTGYWITRPGHRILSDVDKIITSTKGWKLMQSLVPKWEN